LSKLEEAYKQAKKNLEDAQNNMQKVKDLIIKEANGNNIESDLLHVTKVVKKGNVNYKNIPQLKGVDLEEYRGKSSEYWTIKEK